MDYDLLLELKKNKYQLVEVEGDGMRTLNKGEVSTRSWGLSYFRIGENGWKDGKNSNPESKVLLVPDLKELIEACMPRELEIKVSSHSDGSAADCIAWVGDGTMKGEGSTPEEAVARLWLILNKK